MPRLRLVLEYDGACFQGWQIQPRGPTVQGALEEAFGKLTGGDVRVIGASRTDSGVHARGQVAHCDVTKQARRDWWRKSLNAVLPPGVAVLSVQTARPDFHARRDAISKLYCYRVLNRPAGSPLRAGQTWHVRSALDVRAMQAAAVQLLGHHDFSAFRGAPGGAPSDERTERTLDRLDVLQTGDEVRLWAESRSFMRYMVRNLAGTLVEVGMGRRGADSIAAILQSGDRAQAGITAPAWGLCLESIRYPQRPASEPLGDAAGMAGEDPHGDQGSLDP